MAARARPGREKEAPREERAAPVFRAVPVERADRFLAAGKADRRDRIATPIARALLTARAKPVVSLAKAVEARPPRHRRARKERGPPPRVERGS